MDSFFLVEEEEKRNIGTLFKQHPRAKQKEQKIPQLRHLILDSSLIEVSSIILPPSFHPFVPHPEIR